MNGRRAPGASGAIDAGRTLEGARTTGTSGTSGTIGVAGLAPLVWREWRHHPWRHAVALLAVSLGVALAWSVHLINRSALAEFAAAVRSANGEPDLTLAGQREGFDDALFAAVLADEAVAQASAVVEVQTYARAGGEPLAAVDPAAAGASTSASGSTSAAALPAAQALDRGERAGGRVAVRVLGVDALRIAALAPALLPLPARGESPLVFLDPGVVFVNGAARERLQGAWPAAGTAAPAGAAPAQVQVQAGPHWTTLRVAGEVASGGGPLVVMDIAAAQRLFGFAGSLSHASHASHPTGLSRISRIDLRLAPGHDAASLRERLARLPLPPSVRALAPTEADASVSDLSRAYRVNLTVLAGVALFVGGFLVFSVVALSVAQRTPALALLGVLGLTARGRRALVLGECAVVGLVGGLLGVAAGTALAALALVALAGDLGGGYFPGVRPALHWSTPAAAVFVALGVASAVAGGWFPARAARRLQPAVALKGLGDPAAPVPRVWPALALLALGFALAFVPPVAGLPLAAYAAVAALLCGGVAAVPAVVHALTLRRPRLASALVLLAWRRAAHHRGTATAATAGVVASLALSVALTVMVASFRTSVSAWLDQVLPADLYARSAATAVMAETAWLPPGFDARVQHLPGVQRVAASRVRSLELAPGRPAVTLMARPLDGAAADAAATTPLALVAPALAPHGTLPDVFVSEAVQALYGAQPGGRLTLPLPAAAPAPGAGIEVHVRGVYRDFARQFGSIAIERATYRRLTGDDRISDLALWLAPDAEAAAVMAAVRALLPEPALLDFASTGELRAVSLRIFDRSFAVTYYLQAVAIAIGLVGIAASLSAQVLARRKEFGLLAHLGLTRRQVLAVVAGEAAAWVAAGTLVGLALGLAVSAVLVHVVNPQSFHWTMTMVLPAGRLAALCAAVFAAGTLTSAWAARGATAASAVLSVKEDW